MIKQKKNQDPLQDRKRCLLFRAGHRGTYEMDLLIGKYAEIHVPNMNIEELVEFEHIMTLSDIDLTAWLSGSRTVPEHEKGPVLLALRDFAQKHYFSETKRG